VLVDQLVFNTMGVIKSSEAAPHGTIRERSLAVAAQAEEQQGWLERKLKPKKISARYPFKGKALLYTTCAFGSLGDALFGYNSGRIPRNRLPQYILIK
jgi:hypothetical protein